MSYSNGVQAVESKRQKQRKQEFQRKQSEPEPLVTDEGGAEARSRKVASLFLLNREKRSRRTNSDELDG